MMNNKQKLIMACLFSIFSLTGCGSSGPSGAYLNGTQETFEGTRATFNKNYKSAQNEIQKSAVFNKANDWTKQFARGEKYQIKDWRGVVKNISTSHGGDSAFLTVKALDRDGTEVDYKTSQTEALDTSDTAIPKDSPVYAELASLKEGDKVLFSGNFLPSKEKGLQEASVTESGSLDNPEFYVKFKDIHKVDF